MVSLHGGHSGEFCEHAEGTLRETIEAAIDIGLSAYGISEHAPRYEERHIYDSERGKGYTLERLSREFESYASTSRKLQEEFAGRFALLRGFEAEAVPEDRYVDLMQALRNDHMFDYCVGSVHHVAGISIDESPAHCRQAIEACGGVAAFARRYFQALRTMIEALRPDVLAHFDLLKLYLPRNAVPDDDETMMAASGAMDAALRHGCIMDLNTAGWRKGLGEPYPGPRFVQMARDRGVPFCFGDDSHRPEQVGAYIDRARQYLQRHGVMSVTVLERIGSRTRQRVVPLPEPGHNAETA